MLSYLNGIKLKNWQINLLLFFTLAVGVCLIQYLLLQPVFKQGLTADDWKLLFEYKTYGPYPVSDLLTAWRLIGAYSTSQFYYIGVLESIFGINYQAFHIVNVILKAIATLLVFPVILVIFKRRLLAVLATILYAINPASTGSLQYVVKGTEYLAISAMLLFFIAYYYTFQNGRHLINRFSLFIPSLFLLMTFLVSPIRIYPLFILLLLIEIFLLIRFRSKSNLIKSLTILTALYLPIFLISILSLQTTSIYLRGPAILLNQIMMGNWQLILTPLSGLGYVFLTDNLLKFFWVLNPTILKN